MKLVRGEHVDIVEDAKILGLGILGFLAVCRVMPV